MKFLTSIPLTLFFLSSLISLSFSQNTTVWPPYLSNLTQLQCSNMNAEANFCTMQSPVSSGFVWDNANSTIEFSGFVVNLQGIPNCQIFIRARNVWFEHSNITGCDIIIEASLSVKMDNSILSVDGSQSLGPGYVDDSDIGNSYAGAGGYCEDGLAPDNTYGDFMTQYDDDVNAFGTGGPGNYSQGGGRIVIITKEFSAIGSAITANGYPQYCPSNQTSTKGGTGGYIYLNAQSTLVPYQQNAISAQGGLGCENTSFGGSGGRVIISADPGLGNKFNVSINGGAASLPCATGASGTLYCENYSSVAPNALFVTQNAQQGTTIPTPTYVNLTARQNLTLMGGPGATIAVQSPGENDSGPIELQSLLLFNETRLIYSVGSEQSDNGLNITIDGIASVEHSEIWCNCDLTLKVQDMMAVSKQSFISSGASNSTINLNASTLVLQNSSIIFSEISPLLQMQQMSPNNPNESSDYSDFSDSLYDQLANTLFSNRGYLPMTSLIINAGQTTVSSAYIQSSFIYLNTSELEHDGLITATNQTCTSQSLPVRTQAVNPTLYDLDINQMASAFNYQDPSDFIEDYVFHDYTVMVIVQDQATINGVIQGSRIGLFGSQINISQTGTVSAAGLGCPSNQGPGFGVMGTDLGSTCASAGGSYGAAGGAGLSIGSADTASQCLASQLETVPTAYGDPQNPLYEGSGGGSYNGTLGGSGGGVIIVGALNILNVQGVVNASGSAPNSVGSGATGPNGAGAGAGGSIQIYMNQLIGTGSIIASGGSIPSGSWGGVGSGGRVSINFLEWSQILSATDAPVLPSLLVNSGLRYGDTEAISTLIPGVTLSGNGSLSGTPCPPGYFGLFCEPCNGSVFKDDFSANQCHPCIIPSGATLNNEFAQQSYVCDFSCEYEVSIGGTRTCVSNMMLYNIHNGGMYAGLFAVGAAIIVGMYFVAYVLLKKKNNKLDQRSAFSSVSNVNLADFKMKGKYFTNSHVQRINFFGDNTPESRWFINTDTLNLREMEQIRDKIDHLIKSINRTTGWKKTWVYFLKFFVIAYPPIYFYLLQKFRGKLYRKIKTLVKEINHELKEYCVLRSLPVYYISLNVDRHLSSGYLDLFQDDGNYSARNNVLPVSITIMGNGKFSSPYRIDKSDPMLEHLAVNWAPKNCLVIDEDIIFFRYEFRRFITKFNKKAKYIDYSGTFKSFQSSLAETIKEVSKFKEIFANNYNLYFNLFAFEIPRFALDETNAIQPLLQSPVRVTILEDSQGDEFEDLTRRIQRLKTEDEYDVKLFLIVNSSRDLQGMSQKVVNKRATSVFPMMEEKLQVSNQCSQPKANDLEELKQNFYKKLDDISFNIEYSIPRHIGNANPSLKKKQKISSATKKVYATSRRYFKGMHKIFNALVGFKQTQKIVNIYSTVSILLIVNLGFLWFRAVSIFELAVNSYLWMIWFPFPLVTVFSPIFGLLGVISRNSRITLYFALLNSCCLVNHVLSLIIVASTSHNPLIMYIFEVLCCLLYILTLFACKYLLPLQS